MSAAFAPRAAAGLIVGALLGAPALAWPASAGAAPRAALVAVNATAVEGASVVFVVRLTRPAKTTVRVSFKTVNGTAVKGKDYRARTGTLLFKRGQSAKKVVVRTVNDAKPEATERLKLRLTAPRGAPIKRALAAGTILDDDPPPRISIGDVTVPEGDSGTATATFSVTLSRTWMTQVTVAYTTVNGTALAGSDYQATSGTVSFAPGQKAKNVVVPIIGDTVDEDDETFTVSLSTPTGRATILKGTGLGTIADDDDAVADVGVTIADDPDPIVAGAPLTYTVGVQNSGPDRAPAATLVDDLPAGLAFVSALASSGSCSFASPRITCALGTIPSGASRSVTIVVEPVASGLIANTVSVSGAYTDGNPANDSATTDTTVAEGADVSVTLAESSDPVLAGQELTYSLVVANRGPFPASDPLLTQTIADEVTFVSASPGCDFADGVVTCDEDALGTSLGVGASIPLEVVVSRSAPEQVTFGSTATITTSAPEDPDPADNSASVTTTYVPAGDLTLSLGSSGGPVDEGESLSWTVTLENQGPNDAANVSVTQTRPSGFTLEEVTTSHGVCFPLPTEVSCSLGTLAPGTVVTIVLAGRPAAGSVGTTLATTATATSDTADPTPADNGASNSVKVQPLITINDVSGVEPKGVFPAAGTPRTVLFVFTVSLSRPSPQTVTVSFATADGTATAGLDYYVAGGALGFPPGQTTVQAGVTVVSDGSSNLVEPDETFFVNLSNAVNGTLADPQGLGTILEN
jgi:uncharacterized repeat protein (TIGR01451 family)